MAEDWAAVSRAINGRLAELNLSQRELIERSQVSKATVMEIRHNDTQRRRSSRTLEASSLALDWHPQHLNSVLTGQRIPELGEPSVRSEDDTQGRLAAIEYRLEQLSKQLEEINGFGKQLDEISEKINKLFRSTD